jgi:signal transduction histidine kinase
LSLDKVISILLDNAIKYSLESTEVTIRTYQKEGRGYLEVRDQGIGIKATELPHIFDRFYRADSSRSKSHVAGHGLGLSIAKKLVESLDGTIDVVSTPGKGSVFTISFPIAA